MVQDARVLLGVTGSIAAYKAVELARLLQKRGADVQVAMSRGATRFVQPLTFEAITSKPVLIDVFDLGLSAASSAFVQARSRIQHVEQAHGIDLLVVAPASANALAGLAHGFADQALSAIALATKAPILAAPAMEPGMWENEATRENVARLARRGVTFVGPVDGALASGRSGTGRMEEPALIVEAACRLLAPRDFAGLRVLVTAGPTWEALDPVRILSNRSTGAMGIELAVAAARRGAAVTLILGPTHLVPPDVPGLATIRIESALDMLAAARAHAGDLDVLIASAAVSDFRPARPSASKLKRSDASAETLELVENPDVLATLATECRGRDRPVTIVGFAAETEEVERHAREKLARKGCDLVIANLVGRDKGFGPGETAVLAIPAQGAAVDSGPARKSQVAQFVLDQVMWVRKQRQSR